jgi:eukaryotic-like serine/threonine-protein kinase
MAESGSLTGNTVSHYRILEKLGAGGMGEVYRARDTKLGRDVAIKVLPDAFAHDTERLARFQREAKVLASLNHPNIASVYGLEEIAGSTHLVMELVPGDTLADRIKRNGALPLEEALTVAKQIAEGLEAAHDKGIIHRDLKPANVKVTPEGKVKVLDFGMAKALATDIGQSDPANTPTLSHAATTPGVILGTIGYMSPEQARGKTVDKRTDLWAFGCVLYEMLCGHPAFGGEDTADILAAIVKMEPDWTLLPATIPVKIRDLLRRCLQKDKTLRMQAAGDARIEIQEVLTSPEAPEGTAVGPTRPGRAWRYGAILAAAVVALIAVATWNLMRSPATLPPLVSRLVINLPPGDQLAALDYPAIAISPDGTQLAYVAIHSRIRQIYLRKLDSLEARPLPGTEGANTPFFSPDGGWLGFFADGALKKISVSGGAAETLAVAANPRGGSWTSNGRIVFTPNGTSTLVQVSEVGGAARPLMQLDNGELTYRWPNVLPGSKAVLFDVIGANPQIVVQSLNAGSSVAAGPSEAVAGERRSLVPDGTSPHYAASGHLLYAQGGNLMAAPFDPGRLQLTGPAVPVVEGVLQLGNSNGAAQYCLSATGSLAYVAGGVQALEHLVWVNRNGTEQPLAAPPHAYLWLRISPEGRRVALTIEEQETQIWLYDLARETLTRLTFVGNVNELPVWTPDGKRIAFSSSKEGLRNLFWQMADGSGGPEQLTTSGFSSISPSSFSADRQLLAFHENNATTGWDLWVLRLSDRKAQPFLRTSFNEAAASFSPDGRWLAYISDESGRYEVYVQPYPGPGGKYQISSDGGTEPVWNPNGKELFYRSGDKMMSAEIAMQSGFSVSKARMLFQGPYVRATGVSPFYDISHDGQRLLMIKPGDQTSSTSLNQIVIVQNWFEELKRKVPTEEK